ncbi:PLGRKT [Cordylochernes scorpioides]|uniref:PLGRKT n=1 Tax=Cordylochernes scorpioides TaxID=51811 RepID=A0ABY6LH42_9ARAC|nr:PLGRKT [Cordylochernes scorpioides]
MGNNSSQVTSEELKKHQEFLLQMHQAQVEHQIQMRNQMRERMTALQIAKDREMLYWLGAFYLTSTAAMLVGYRRCHRMSVLSPLLPLTFLMGYQADLAYGSKMNRIQSKSSLSLLCRDVVVVVSNEEPQMSPYISITAVVLYLECVKLFFWVYVNFLLLLSYPMKSLRCLHASLSQQCPLSWVCKVAVLGPFQFSVVVVSIEEPQMSPYISITAMSSILGV